MKISEERLSSYIKSLFINNYIIGEVKDLNDIIKVPVDMVRRAAPSEVIVIIEDEKSLFLSTHIKAIVSMIHKITLEEDLWKVTDKVLMKMREVDCSVNTTLVSVLFKYAGLTCVNTCSILEDEELSNLINKVVESTDIRSLGLKGLNV